MDISVSPASFSLAEGESQELVITTHFNAQSKTGWQFASLVLTEGQQKLKMPVSVKFKAGTGPFSAVRKNGGFGWFCRWYHP